MTNFIQKTFWTTPRDKKISVIVLSIIGTLIIFKMGMFVGYHKALFSYRSDAGFGRGMEMNGDKYGLPKPGFMNEEFSTSHGAVGRIVSVSLPSFVVAGPDNSEKTVTVGDRTMIRRMKDTVSASDIRTDDFAVVLGEPNEAGKIDAKFVRLMPLPPMFMSSTTSR
jgi:hypothetical protein